MMNIMSLIMSQIYVQSIRLLLVFAVKRPLKCKIFLKVWMRVLLCVQFIIRLLSFIESCQFTTKIKNGYAQKNIPFCKHGHRSGGFGLLTARRKYLKLEILDLVFFRGGPVKKNTLYVVYLVAIRAKGSSSANGQKQQKDRQQ